MKKNSLGLNKAPEETKVCVAMSGGVDSSVTAYLLKKQGYNVFGMTMDLLESPYASQKSSISDAAAIAEQLGIPHFLLDMKQAFRQGVIDYFCQTYIGGETPSPCIMCNKKIKLGLLADKARENGADILVTGHYAKTEITASGVELHRGDDPVRDQSYFLFAVSKKKLQMLRCPLAAYSKDTTRKIAEEAGLKAAHKADSQDICFVSSGKYSNLVQTLAPEAANLPGDIVTTDGEVIGQHKGLINYTIGQRRGLGIGGRKGQQDGDVYYVLRLDTVNNRLVAARQEELYQTEVFIKDINWLGEEQPQRLKLDVKLRSRQAAVPAEVDFFGSEAVVRLAEPFAAAAPGQGCCFYDGTRVLGGGFIKKS